MIVRGAFASTKMVARIIISTEGLLFYFNKKNFQTLAPLASWHHKTVMYFIVGCMLLLQCKENWAIGMFPWKAIWHIMTVPSRAWVKLTTVRMFC